MVVPVDRLSGGELDMVDATPGTLLLDQLGLVEAVDRLGQRVVERRADSTGRGPNTGCSETFAMGQRDVLRPVVVVVDQPGQISPSSRARVQMACSTAPRTSRVVIEVPARQPRMRRA